jgi:hypothetical protein
MGIHHYVWEQAYDDLIVLETWGETVGSLALYQRERGN